MVFLAGLSSCRNFKMFLEIATSNPFFFAISINLMAFGENEIY